MPSPEELAREKIDPLLQQCGWMLQNRSTINLSASRGVAIREALLKDRDEADYLLFVDGKAIGTVEAKSEGFTLTGVEETIRRLRQEFIGYFIHAGVNRSRSPMKVPASKRSSRTNWTPLRRVATSSPSTNPRRCSNISNPTTSSIPASPAF